MQPFSSEHPFAVISCINKFSVKGQVNFEIKVIKFIEVTEDIVYEKCPNLILKVRVRN